MIPNNTEAMHKWNYYCIKCHRIIVGIGKCDMHLLIDNHNAGMICNECYKKRRTL